MIEHLNYNDLGEREVFIYWDDHWYRMPFYLLRDIKDQWQEAGRKKEAHDLMTWLGENEFTHKNSDAIPRLKDLLANEMQFMSAYEYFTDEPLTTEPDADELERIEDEKFITNWIEKHRNT